MAEDKAVLPPTSPPLIFNRRKVRHNRDRAARHYGSYDFALTLAAERLVERYDDMHLMPNTIVELGAHTGQLKTLLSARNPQALYIQSDLSLAMLKKNNGLRVVADEEYLPFAPGSCDLIISSLSLHWINDLPGTLLQIQQCLAPNGVFLANMAGTNTLIELRQCFLNTELRSKGGASSRISPFIDIKTAGALLQRAGFQMPVSDSDILTLSYPGLSQLCDDLRYCGQSSAFASPTPYLGKASRALLHQHYPQPTDQSHDPIHATLELISLVGLK